MTSAFVFLNCDPKLVDSAKTELKEMPSATGVYETSGIYDIIVRVDAKSEELLRDVIVKIRSLSGLTCTTTTIIAKERNKKEEKK
jgi:DNA-binding Lrp family transcriptional regulator